MTKYETQHDTCAGCIGCGSEGQCGSAACGGCLNKGELILCREEAMILLELSQFAFAPVVQEMQSEKLKYTSVWANILPDMSCFSDVIASLEQKRLISVDPDIPLSNVTYDPWAGDKTVRCGSMALTQKGQEILDWLSPADFGL